MKVKTWLNIIGIILLFAGVIGSPIILVSTYSILAAIVCELSGIFIYILSRWLVNRLNYSMKYKYKNMNKSKVNCTL